MPIVSKSGKLLLVEEDSSAARELQRIEFDLAVPPLMDTDAVVQAWTRECIRDVDDSLDVLQGELLALDKEIDRLTNHADQVDNMLAVSSGILAGLVDIFFVGEFSLERGTKWGSDKINRFVVKIAQKTGYDGDDLEKAIRHLEKKFPAPSDSAYNELGGGLQHHLRDFAHHPTPFGLLFSLMTQFTGMAYGTNTAGMFIMVPVKDGTYIGKTLPEKFTIGVIYWLGHLVSDMAGSSGKPGAGTGIPGPILGLLKEISALPFFNESEAGAKFRLTLSKLFNGTLLSARDESGKIIKAARFDFRAEIGVGYELSRQAVPIIMNEAIVRGFYFFRRCMQQLRKHGNLEGVEWAKTIPHNNRTIRRMLTIATGAFTAVDLLHAGIMAAVDAKGSPVTLPMVLLRVNFVGVGRFAVAIGMDTWMEVQQKKYKDQRMHLRGTELHLENAKLFYMQADMWVEVKKTFVVIDALEHEIEAGFRKASEDWSEIQKSLDNSMKHISEIREKNPERIKELYDYLGEVR